jgi:serine/threonine protein kinase
MSRDKYEKIEKISEGSYGIVYKCRNRGSVLFLDFNSPKSFFRDAGDRRCQKIHRVGRRAQYQEDRDERNTHAQGKIKLVSCLQETSLFTALKLELLEKSKNVMSFIILKLKHPTVNSSAII